MQARRTDGEELATLFLVERGAPGIEVVDDPPFTDVHDLLELAKALAVPAARPQPRLARAAG